MDLPETITLPTFFTGEGDLTVTQWRVFDGVLTYRGFDEYFYRCGRIVKVRTLDLSRTKPIPMPRSET